MKLLKKNRRKLIFGMAAFLILLTAGFLLRIREVEVTGNQKYTKEEIEELVFQGRFGKNAVVCFLKDHFGSHSQIPFVEDYEIRFRGLGKAEVIVYEKSVVGYVSYMGSCMYFDKDGIVVESSSGRRNGIPLVTGLKFGHIALLKPLPLENEQMFGEILNLTQLLSTSGIAAEQIRYDSRQNVTLFIGSIKVYLGSSESIDGKVTELKGQLPVLSGLSGTLYLDTYSEAGAAPSYRFVKEK